MTSSWQCGFAGHSSVMSKYFYCFQDRRVAYTSVSGDVVRHNFHLKVIPWTLLEPLYLAGSFLQCKAVSFFLRFPPMDYSVCSAACFLI